MNLTVTICTEPGVAYRACSGVRSRATVITSSFVMCVRAQGGRLGNGSLWFGAADNPGLARLGLSGPGLSGLAAVASPRMEPYASGPITRASRSADFATEAPAT